MKILILTQYFPPEIGAPQNRLLDLSLKLKNFGSEVVVLTALSNYPKYEIFDAYRGKGYVLEEYKGLTVHRAWIYVSKKKSLIYRLFNYFSFVFSSFWVGLYKIGKVDLIICESPPLFLGLTAVFLKKIKRARLLFNVSDLWPDSAVKLGLVTNPILIWLSSWLETWIYRRSNLISGQTQGIVQHIHARHPDIPIFWFRNGIDPVDIENRKYSENWRINNGFKPGDILVYFGGLMGYAQGLEVILETAAHTASNFNIKYILIGEGPEKERLELIKAAHQLDQVYFFPGVSREAIISVIQEMDMAVIPLRKLFLFEGAIPSKIFEILYLEKPVLLGVAGEAKKLFIEDAGAGMAFEPQNSAELASHILFLLDHPDRMREMGQQGKKYVLNNFNRQQIALDFWNFIQRGNYFLL